MLYFLDTSYIHSCIFWTLAYFTELEDQLTSLSRNLQWKQCKMFDKVCGSNKDILSLQVLTHGRSSDPALIVKVEMSRIGCIKEQVTCKQSLLRSIRCSDEQFIDRTCAAERIYHLDLCMWQERFQDPHQPVTLMVLKWNVGYFHQQFCGMNVIYINYFI